MSPSSEPAWVPANGTEFELFYQSVCGGCVWNGVTDECVLCPVIDADGYDWRTGEAAWRTEATAEGLFEPRCRFFAEKAEDEPHADLESALDRAARYRALTRDACLGRPVIR